MSEEIIEEEERQNLDSSNDDEECHGGMTASDTEVSMESEPGPGPVMSSSADVGPAEEPEPASESGGCSNNVSVLCPCSGSYILPCAATKVYAFGKLGYDFASEARLDSVKQNMKDDSEDPRNVSQLLAHLQKRPWDSSAITWTLNIHATPIYAIAPTGPFTLECYKMLREFLEQQFEGGAERMSVPGILSAQTRLMSGQVIPVITPDIRGLYCWSTGSLVKQVQSEEKGSDKQGSKNEDAAAGIKNFLERIYYELQNMGVESSERALNFAATNAYQVSQVFKDAIKKSFNLSGIDVQRSSICRPDSDCWDVILHFFDPKNKTERARQMYRFTIDVSDVLPVTLGELRSWNEY